MSSGSELRRIYTLRSRLRALEAGKHTFCQARMAMNLAEARSMLAAAGQRPRQVTMLCPPPTDLRCGLYFKKLLDDRVAGTIYHFSLRVLTALWADPWRRPTGGSDPN